MENHDIEPDNDASAGTGPDEKRRKRYATVRHPTIEAVVRKLFRFKDEAQALRRVESIREHFIVARQENAPEVPEGEEPPPVPPLPLKLWIKGFCVTEEDEKKGYLGHYAEIKLKERSDGRLMLIAEKVDMPLKNHPQRKRLQQKHPNWGHPVLRNVKKEKLYNTVEEAELALAQLHDEYPDVSIPGAGKLYIIAFTRALEGQNPIQKIILEIKPRPEGGCVITWRDNKKPLKPKTDKAAAAEAVGVEAPPAKSGYFTSMVELKRKAKGKTTKKPSATSESDAEGDKE